MPILKLSLFTRLFKSTSLEGEDERACQGNDPIDLKGYSSPKGEGIADIVIIPMATIKGRIDKP